MALVTVQRSPCGTNSPDPSSDDEIDGANNVEEGENNSDKKGVSECYFAVKGAALVLPHDECIHIHRKTIAKGACDIQRHLQSMLYLLHADDILKMAVKLESIHSNRTRYLVVVCHTGGNSQVEESCLLGIDCNKETTIGLLLPVWADTRITLDGDGGFSVTSSGRHHIFKPVSVQAMWSALQTLHKAGSKARECNHFQCGGTHLWIEYYEKRINSDRSCLNEWHAMDDIVSRRPPSPDTLRLQPTEREETERHIRTKLKELMMSLDLDEVTSKDIRTRIEEILDMNLTEYKPFIDQEMITILGQMDSPAEIFSYLYLGSEWNASNLEELVVNGIGHILNVTREIDNFFPGMFDYQNIRVYDDESTEILHYWDKTYRYIRRAKEESSKVLVHCKMGISRSASVVIAYVMKEYDWDLQRALDFVKTKRNCIKPNSGFLKQLEIYQGILDASKQRHNSLWRSKSETNLKSSSKPKKKEDEKKHKVPEKCESLHHLTVNSGVLSRPKSWSPSEAIADMFFPSPNRISRTACYTDKFSNDLNENKREVSFQSADHNSNISVDIFNSLVKKSYETSKSTETLSVNALLPRVSSIKDRISELALQVISSDKPLKIEPKSPSSQNRSGLVFNLANHFESGSKPSSPVDDGLIMKTLDEAMVQPVVSQMKPPVCKHHAVLVKPSVWPEDSKAVIDPSAISESVTNNSSKVTAQCCSGKTSADLCDTSKQPSDSQSPKASHSVFTSALKSLSTYTSTQAKGLLEKKSKCHQSPDKQLTDSLQSSQIDSPLKETSDIVDPIIGKKGFHTISDKSVPTMFSRTSIISANQCEFTDVQSKCNHFYDKEDIPFTPGKVLRTKQKIEEKNLTRTVSFDSGFPFQTPSTPDPTSEKLIRRSHSLRNDCRSTLPFYGKWYPLPLLASNAPLSLKRKSPCPQSNNSALSASTPSVVEAVNRVICGTQEVLSSAMPTRKKSSSSDSDYDFGSANSLPDIDSGQSPPTHRESPVPGLVKLQREILENKVIKPFSDKFCTDTIKTKVIKPTLAEPPGIPLVISDPNDCEDIKESGIVKRLKKELEAKSSSESCKKERIIGGAGLSEIDDIEHCVTNVLSSLTEKHKSTSSRVHMTPSTGKKILFETSKAPPTPHRKTSLDLSFMQRRFPLNIKLGSQTTAPIIKPSSHNFNTESKNLLEFSTSDKRSILPSKNNPVYTTEIPPIALPRKARKQQGSTHPLSKLIKQRHPNPLYNTM